MGGGRRQEAVSERAKWSEADSPGRGRGAPTASIRQGRVTSVGTANERQQQPPPGPQPERRRRSGPSQAPSGTSRCLEIPCGCKDDTPGEQIQHLTLKKKKPKTKIFIPDQTTSKTAGSNFKTRASWQHAKNVCFGSFTAVEIFNFFIFCPFERERVWSLMLVNSKFTTGI